MSKRKKKVRKVRPSGVTAGQSPGEQLVDNSINPRAKIKAPIVESVASSRRKNNHTLEPFVLPGETLSYELATCLVKEEPQTEEDREKLLEEKIEKKLESRGDEYDDQVDTIPPGDAPNTQVEMKLEMRRSGDFRVLDFNNLPQGMEDDEPSEEVKILEEYKRRKEKDLERYPDDVLVGRILNHKYELYELLERGTVASVYRIRNINTDEKFIAMTCPEEATQKDKERLDQEISTNSKLDHKNIANFVESVEEDNGMKFLIMEETKGVSLDNVLEIHGPIELTDNISRVLSAICDALEHAHSKGIIHRDLQLRNIILTKSDNDDFGLKVVGFSDIENVNEQIENITKAGFLNNLPGFEPVKESMNDEKSGFLDIFALGAIAFQLVSGVPPYPGNTLIDVIINHCNSDVVPVSLTEKAPNMPLVSQLERIILRALETDPSKRIESATEFKLVLQDWVQRAKST